MAFKKNRKRIKAAQVGTVGSDGKETFSSNKSTRRKARSLNKKRRLKNRRGALADKAEDFKGTKRGTRLANKLKRKKERDSGERKTVAGTALAGAKRFLSNYGAATTGQGKIRNFKGLGYKKPNPAAKTPTGSNIRVQNMAADDKKKK